MTARGCSTKDKILHIECENHVMGKTSEKFCYCRTFLCNNALSRDSPLFLRVLVAGIVLQRIFFKRSIGYDDIVNQQKTKKCSSTINLQNLCVFSYVQKLKSIIISIVIGWLKAQQECHILKIQ